MRDSERSQLCPLAARVAELEAEVARLVEQDTPRPLAEELGFVEKKENDKSNWLEHHKKVSDKLNKAQSRVMELELAIKEWIADRNRWFERCKNASADRDKALARLSALDDAWDGIHDGAACYRYPEGWQATWLAEVNPHSPTLQLADALLAIQADNKTEEAR